MIHPLAAVHEATRKMHEHGAPWLFGTGLLTWLAGVNWASILAGAINLAGMLGYAWLCWDERRRKAEASVKQVERLNELEIKLRQLQIANEERDSSPRRRAL